MTPRHRTKGVVFKFYQSMDAAYNDLKAGNVDVLDAMPSSAIGSYQTTFADLLVSLYARHHDADHPTQYLDLLRREGQLRRQVSPWPSTVTDHRSDHSGPHPAKVHRPHPPKGYSR